MARKLSEEIDRHLVGLMSVRGVTAAAVVDADGFVTHIRRDFDIDADALGAAVQIIFGAAQRSAEHVGQGTSRLVVGENRDGVMILAPLSAGFLLAVVTDSSAILGSVRFEVKETVPALNQIFGGKGGR